MEVTVDHQRNVLRAHTDVEQAILQRRRSPYSAVLDAVNVIKLLIFLVSGAGIDQYRADLVVDEQTAHAELDAVLLVGHDAALPERLGDNAEHRAAVQLLAARLDRVDRPPAKAPGFDAGAESRWRRVDGRRHAVVSLSTGRGDAGGRRGRYRFGAGVMSKRCRSCHVSHP